MSFLSKHDMITPDQSAYLRHHSTQTALLKVTNQWYENIEDGLITGVCFFDISKCFDSISHEILIFKLVKYGIINDALSWFLSYLSARTRCTLCNNSMSSFQTVTSGVPQGSLLGPILFLLFINDLPKFIQNCNLYADDTEMEVVGKTMNEVVSSLQTQIDNLNNRLTVNASKSCSMLIGSRQKIGNDASRSSLGLFLNGEPINNQTTYKYLGLTIDCLLSFDVMIDNICNKLKCRVAMIQRIRYFLSSHHLSSLYYAFIQPFIDYCILIWGHSSASNLNRIQNCKTEQLKILKTVMI